jgi:hypothetical protein
LHLVTAMLRIWRLTCTRAEFTGLWQAVMGEA